MREMKNEKWKIMNGKCLLFGGLEWHSTLKKVICHRSFDIDHFSFLSLVMLAFFLSCNFVDQFFLLANSSRPLGCPLRAI